MINPINNDIIQNARFKQSMMSSTLMEKSAQRANIINEIIDSPIAMNLKRIIVTIDKIGLSKIATIREKST